MNHGTGENGETGMGGLLLLVGYGVCCAVAGAAWWHCRITGDDS